MYLCSFLGTSRRSLWSGLNVVWYSHTAPSILIHFRQTAYRCYIISGFPGCPELPDRPTSPTPNPVTWQVTKPRLSATERSNDVLDICRASVSGTKMMTWWDPAPASIGPSIWITIRKNDSSQGHGPTFGHFVGSWCSPWVALLELWGEMVCRKAGSSDMIQAVPPWNLANCNSSALRFTRFTIGP